MKILKRLLPLLLILLVPMTALAAGTIDPNQEAGLTIQAVFDKTPIGNMNFSLYRVCTVDTTGELTPTEAFAAYADRLDIRGRNDEAWQALAPELEQAVYEQKIQPQATAQTADSGKVAFQNLPQGLYLVTAQGVELEGYVYTTEPFFVNLPSQDLTTNTWCYQLTASAKLQQNPLLTDLAVVKIWKDACHESQRPNAVTVELLQDGLVYDTVTLSNANRWQHTWNDLDVNHKWSVREQTVSGYAAPTITQEGNTFTITNTCNKPTESATPTLPQTGQLWWPVPVLMAAGLLMLIIGLIRRRNSDSR